MTVIFEDSHGTIQEEDEYDQAMQEEFVDKTMEVVNEKRDSKIGREGSQGNI